MISMQSMVRLLFCMKMQVTGAYGLLIDIDKFTENIEQSDPEGDHMQGEKQP